MPWVKVKRVNVPSSDPMISLNNNRFSYNAIFSRIVDLDKFSYVSYYIDNDDRKIGFEFKKEEDSNTFKIVKSPDKGNYSQCTELFRIPWIFKASQQKGLNRFKPIRDGKIWAITLMPIFENSIKRDKVDKIGYEVRGIYRYVDNGRVVYIGKGVVRQRLQELQRGEWKFDTIEYSVIEDDESQFEWESFWIERHKYENENYLPAYNSISGR